MNRPPDGQMVRPREGRVIAGVALAVADRLGMAPGAVRLIWFILSFFGGFGLLLYIAGWLLIREEGAEQSIAEDVTDRLGDSTAWLGVGLIVIAGVILITMLGWVRSDLAWAVALLSVGVLMYQGHLGTAFGPRPSGSDEPGTDSPGDGGEADAETVVAESATAEPLPDPAPTEPILMEPADEERTPRPPRERSFLGRLTMGTVFIGLGIMAMLDTSDVIRPAFSHYMALAVGIVGVGLLVGSAYGRSRGLIFAGLVLVPILLVSSVVTAAFEGGWGDPVFRPASLNDVDNHYTLTGGDMEIDLRRIDLDGKVVKIEGDLGFGRLLVLVPEGVGLDVTAHVGFGDVIMFGDHNGGVDVDRTVRFDGNGVIELDLDVGFGALEIAEVSR
jgi:phage shock protein PspC (stress-responsive transcriptional regulator)